MKTLKLFFLHFRKVPFNPLSRNSDQDQFSLNDIHTLSRDLVMRIYKMNTYCFALIFYQILSTHFLRKCIDQFGEFVCGYNGT